MAKVLGVLLFSDVEELDFAGPWEVFGAFAKYVDTDWTLVTVAETRQTVICNKGLRVLPDHTFEDCPPLDVLVVPGGQGTRREVDNDVLTAFVRRVAARCQLIASVCTGTFILRRAGLLNGRRATTHWASLAKLREDPTIQVVDERFVQDGNVITAAGVSAGIDMALHALGQIAGEDVGRNVQKLIEYYPEPPYGGRDAAIAAKGAN